MSAQKKNPGKRTRDVSPTAVSNRNKSDVSLLKDAFRSATFAPLGSFAAHHDIVGDLGEGTQLRSDEISLNGAAAHGHDKAKDPEPSTLRLIVNLGTSDQTKTMTSKRRKTCFRGSETDENSFSYSPHAENENDSLKDTIKDQKGGNKISTESQVAVVVVVPTSGTANLKWVFERSFIGNSAFIKTSVMAREAETGIQVKEIQLVTDSECTVGLVKNVYLWDRFGKLALGDMSAKNLSKMFRFGVWLDHKDLVKQMVVYAVVNRAELAEDLTSIGSDLTMWLNDFYPMVRRRLGYLPIVRILVANLVEAGYVSCEEAFETCWDSYFIDHVREAKEREDARIWARHVKIPTKSGSNSDTDVYKTTYTHFDASSVTWKDLKRVEKLNHLPDRAIRLLDAVDPRFNRFESLWGSIGADYFKIIINDCSWVPKRSIVFQKDLLERSSGFFAIAIAEAHKEDGSVIIEYPVRESDIPFSHCLTLHQLIHDGTLALVDDKLETVEGLYKFAITVQSRLLLRAVVDYIDYNCRALALEVERNG